MIKKSARKLEKSQNIIKSATITIPGQKQSKIDEISKRAKNLLKVPQFQIGQEKV